MSPELSRELGRKAFHMLTLAYLGAYHLVGFPQVLPPLSAWFLLITALETARLRLPAVNDRLHRLFEGLARAEEYGRYSGVFHSTAGALLLIWLWGDHPRLVDASLLCVAFGDAAAALVGKAVGRHRLPFGKKSWEGSAACLFVCAAVGAALGYGPLPTFALAATATAIELVPASGWFNDNLWMPVATGLVLRLCAG